MEKLNKLERLKADLKPADFDLSVVNWSNPSEEDRFYLKSFGIYNIKLRPEVYMLRLRIDGGMVDKALLLELVRYVSMKGYRLIVTARAQMEVHHIPAGQIMEAYRGISDIGFESRQTLTDNFRAITIDPYDGVAHDSYVECVSLVDEIAGSIIGHRDWMGTIPRKFNTSIISRIEPVINPWSNDLLFALARQGEEHGFNLYLGGKNNQTARSADIFATPDQVPSLFLAVARVFDKHGLRGSRSKNRLFFLIEQIGMTKTRELVEEEFGVVLPRSGRLLMKSSESNMFTHLKNGNRGRIIKCRNGEIETERIVQILERLQDGEELRLGSDQNLHLIENKRYEGSGDKPAKIIFCAGERYCPLSLWDIKHDDGILPQERLARLGISVGFSGCLKGCARHLHSDIGLVGLRTNLYGHTERALRVYIGATQGEDAVPSRMLYYSVPERCLWDLIGVVLDEYDRSGLKSFEDFARDILARFDDEFLQLWFLSLVLSGEMDGLSRFDTQKAAISSLISKGVLGINDDVNSVIRELSHKAWDQV